MTALRQIALVAIQTNPTSPQALALRCTFPTAYIGQAYSGIIQAIGGTGTGYILATVTKPAWMTITQISATYWIATGTPTTPTGRQSIQLSITDSSSTTTPYNNLGVFVSYTITTPGQIISSGRFVPPTAYTGNVAYEYDVLAPYIAELTLPIVSASVSQGTLPTGMSLTSSFPSTSLKISASNVTGATADVSITFTDSSATAKTLVVPLHLAVAAGLSISTDTSISVNVGQDVGETGSGVTVTGGSGKYSIIADPANPMPAGTSVHPKSGLFYGRSTAISPTSAIPATKFIVTDLVTGQQKTTVAGVKIITSAISKPAPAGQVVTHDSTGAQVATDVFGAFFGDGLDGAVTINGTNTYSFAGLSGGVNSLTRDLYCDTLTITGSGKLNTNGHDIYCRTLIDISNAGANGIFCSPSATGSILPNAVSATGAPYGADGGASVVGGTGVGTTGLAGAQLVVGVSGGGQGGPGGAGASGGGSVAAATSPKVQPPLPRSVLVQDVFQIYPGLAAGISANDAVPIGGGCGGGSGGGGGGNGSAGGSSGAGGGGGPRIRIFARSINRGASTAVGAINVTGQKAANGSNGPAASRGAGGGGAGGGGGYLHLVFLLLLGSPATNCLQANGGDGGDGGASGGLSSAVGTGGDGGPCGAILVNDMLTPTTTTYTTGTGSPTHSGQTHGTGVVLQASL